MKYSLSDSSTTSFWFIRFDTIIWVSNLSRDCETENKQFFSKQLYLSSLCQICQVHIPKLLQILLRSKFTQPQKRFTVLVLGRLTVN